MSYFAAQLSERIGIRLAALGDQVAQLVEVLLMTWRRSDQQHAAGLRTGISERVRCAGWDKYASSRSAAHGTLATAQIELSFENVKDLLDFGVVMRTSHLTACVTNFYWRKPKPP